MILHLASLRHGQRSSRDINFNCYVWNCCKWLQLRSCKRLGSMTSVKYQTRRGGRVYTPGWAWTGRVRQPFVCLIRKAYVHVEARFDNRTARLSQATLHDALYRVKALYPCHWRLIVSQTSTKQGVMRRLGSKLTAGIVAECGEQVCVTR